MPETGNMSSKVIKMNSGSFAIGNFHLGKCGSDWSTWDGKVIFHLNASDFDSAKSEAYDKICEYYKEHNLPRPPKPA